MIKRFEQFNINDPYNEENWNDAPKFKKGDNVKIKNSGVETKIVDYFLRDDGFWYDLDIYIRRREDQLELIDEI